MLSEKERGALRDILVNIELAEGFARKHTPETLKNDVLSLYAIVRGLEIISEASRRLSPELKARHPEIPWRDMAAAGNFYRHNYEDVTPTRIWKTLREDLPPLRAVVEYELK
ncbi:MAG: DUF86 domain-containing protein [Xanthobacteraceae bacterium]|nr:DUF86 domain-containing protein [Xanthobacteraceae bacterium]